MTSSVSSFRQLVFLLSPAHCGGRRAQFLMNPRSDFPLGQRLQDPEGISLGEAFSFMSGLYFRGKLAYAEAFTRPRGPVPVIAPGKGLLDARVRVRRDDLMEMAQVPVSLDEPRYRRPLERDVRSLAATLDGAGAVVLLGSIATDKYVDVLVGVLGDRLLFPSDFLGRGDMSRGALMLRSVERGRELSYQPVAGAVRHGPRARRIAEML